jgi:hypothetical protein
MKKLFILLLALGATQTHAAEQKIPAITITNSTDRTIKFVVNHRQSCSSPTELIVHVGRTMTFTPDCMPTFVRAIPREQDGAYLNPMNAVPKGHTASSPVLSISTGNRSGDVSSLSFEATLNQATGMPELREQ